LEAGGCIGEVFSVPFYCGVVASCAAEVVAVVAVVVSVEDCKYDYRLDVSSQEMYLPGE
jgi:hypothetical protein